MDGSSPSCLLPLPMDHVVHSKQKAILFRFRTAAGADPCRLVDSLPDNIPDHFPGTGDRALILSPIRNRIMKW